MDISQVRRRVARDLSDRFPNPSRAQQEVIDAALRTLRDVERALQSLERNDATPKITWMDRSFMGVNFDADRASPRRDSDRKSNVDSLLDFLRKNGWTGGTE